MTGAFLDIGGGGRGEREVNSLKRANFNCQDNEHVHYDLRTRKEFKDSVHDILLHEFVKLYFRCLKGEVFLSLLLMNYWQVLTLFPPPSHSRVIVSYVSIERWLKNSA